MATIVPHDIERLELSGVHGGELETLKQLKKSLSNDYIVFHSVHWSLDKGNRAVFGEIDFVIVNKSGDILLIEQKNGMIEETNQGLMKNYRGSRPKDIVQQICNSVNVVRDKLNRTLRNQKKIKIEYLLLFPDYKVVNINAAGVEARNIVDASTIQDLDKHIANLIDAGTDDKDGLSEFVLDFFYQSFDIVPDVHAFKDAQHRVFVRQSGGLIKMVDNLEMSPFRLRIIGAAGCGKTLLASRFYHNALAKGKKPLMVCFNRPLANKLKDQVDKGGYVNTWFGLCDEYLRSIGQPLNFKEMNSDPAFWQNAHNSIVDSNVPEEWLFDTVIVDEGQDLNQEIRDILEFFKKENADILWLEDPLQNVRSAGATPMEGMVSYTALENYRTPYSIAQFIQATLPYDIECANGLPGMGVRVTPYDKPTDQKKAVEKIIRDLMKAGFKHEDIVILTCRGLGNSPLDEFDKLADLTIQRYTGLYNGAQQEMTEGRLYFETIRRFKGQQAPAIILVDVDPNPEKLESENMLLYTGMTRATVRLEMLAKSDNPKNKRFFDASNF